MAFNLGNASRVLLNEKHVSGAISGWTASWQREMATVTSLLDSGTKCVPGLVEGTLNVEGHFDSTSDLYTESLAANGVDNGLVFTVWPAGGTIGNPAIIGQADLSSLEIEAEVGDKVSIAVEATGDDGIDVGYSYHDLGAETATGNNASVDDLPTSVTTSTNGGVGVLHVTAISGTSPSCTVKIQDSADNSTFADILTFTAATAVTSERKTITGTVRRYVRSTRTITGTGPSCTYAVSFARR